MRMSLVLQLCGHKPKYWTNLDLMRALDGKLGDQQSLYDSSSEDHECLYEILLAIHEIVVEIFQSGWGHTMATESSITPFMLKFKVQSGVRTREDEKTERKSHRERWIIGRRWPVTARCLSLVLFSRSPWRLGWRTGSSSLEGIHHVGKVFERKQQTHCAGLQLGHRTVCFIWQDTLPPMLGMSRDGGRRGQNARAIGEGR